MSILLVYATVEGQTGKIARTVGSQLAQTGCEVRLFDTAQKTASVSFDGVKKVILAAPVHERRHPQTFEVFLSAHRAELEKCDTLMLSVSLSAAFPEGLQEADDYVTEMEMRTKFMPRTTVLVAGAVRALSYDYYATQIVRHVVLRDRHFESSLKEHEFTDWQALADDVGRFVEIEAAPM